MDQSDRRGLEVSPLVRMGRMEQEVIAGAEEVAADLIILAEARSGFLEKRMGTEHSGEGGAESELPGPGSASGRKKSQKIWTG